MDPKELTSCINYAREGLRQFATDRTTRFLGKVKEDTARCRGGNDAVNKRRLPWMDWQNYWATGDYDSKVKGVGAIFGNLGANGRGIRGALLDFEYQRMEMIKFNLFDNTGTYEKYVKLWGDPAGIFHDPYVEMRVPEKDPPSSKVDNSEYDRLKKMG